MIHDDYYNNKRILRMIAVLSLLSLERTTILTTTTAFHTSTTTTRRSRTVNRSSIRLYESSSSQNNVQKETNKVEESNTNDFVEKSFELNTKSDDDTSKSMSVLRSMSSLANGSDIRGTFVDHPRMGSIASVAHTIAKDGETNKSIQTAALTPLAAYCIGQAFALQMIEQDDDDDDDNNSVLTICIGTDPRVHGPRLADAFARGAKHSSSRIRILYTGLATTPSIMEFCRSGYCDAGVMVTASHLPSDRNGFKFFSTDGGYTPSDISSLMEIAQEQLGQWQNLGILPSMMSNDDDHNAVFADETVDFMPLYVESLREALYRECEDGDASHTNKRPLEGLKIVLNAGHGSGGFFAKSVLEELGADISGSLYLEPDFNFPRGVPNPENEKMIEQTRRRCMETHADLGIMLDTDADRSGFIVPDDSDTTTTSTGEYQPLCRNRLIAVMGVIYSLAQTETEAAPTIVTDSTTSEGLSQFLTSTLGLQHVRYKRGYANVIAKAKSIPSAEVAIETSGHCALKENGYLDDGTYTAIKLIGLMARTRNTDDTVLNFIQELEEMPIEREFRFTVLREDGDAVSVFEHLSQRLLEHAAKESSSSTTWTHVTEDNYEGLRLRIAGENNQNNGAFFMIRPSLHDPVLSLQMECESNEQAKHDVIRPLLEVFENDKDLSSSVDFSSLLSF